MRLELYLGLLDVRVAGKLALKEQCAVGLVGPEALALEHEDRRQGVGTGGAGSEKPLLARAPEALVDRRRRRASARALVVLPLVISQSRRGAAIGCAARNACAIHAYVLMTNHVHLLVSPARPGGVGRMLVEAIVDRIERRGASPDAVLALTFSRKAAEQLREELVPSSR